MALRRAWASSPVTYRRSGQADLVGMLAEFAKMSEEVVEGDGGVYVAVDQYQFRFLAADLVIGGVPSQPAMGDKIVDAAGVIYQVMPLIGQNSWEWTDHNLRYRVYCKRVPT